MKRKILIPREMTIAEVRARWPLPPQPKKTETKQPKKGKKNHGRNS